MRRLVMLIALAMPLRKPLGGIRCDPSFYNTTADIDRLLHVLARHC